MSPRGRWVAAAVWLWVAAAASGAEPFAALEAPSTPPGYLARLLINEAPFPGERGYASEEDTKAAMLSVLWVLHARLNHIPEGYTQERIAAVRTRSVIELITANNQCEGFHLGADGRPATEARVEARIENLLRIANSGEAPGRFARLLTFGQGLSSAYLKGGIPGADRFAGLERVDRVAVTGRAYSWMTGRDYYHPGGNFIGIPDGDQGLLGGNRFFTLRKEPR
jgi:hypothetical protein